MASDWKVGDRAIIRENDHEYSGVEGTVIVVAQRPFYPLTLEYKDGYGDTQNEYFAPTDLEVVELPSTQPKEAVETRTTSATGAEKGVKPARFGLIPSEALTKVAEHYGKGAEKYAAHNWRKGYEWSKSYDALQRHANAFWQGEDNDPEFGTPHMAAVVFHALTLLTFMDEQQSFDDRFKQLEDAQ